MGARAMNTDASRERWPELPFSAWADTSATLQRWMQIVGKVRLALSPWVNHSWHVPLYVTARGLTTSLIPHTRESFEIEFDFVAHQLVVRASGGELRAFAFAPMPVAEFYERLMTMLRDLDLPVTIFPLPNELEDATPLDEDREHRAYDPESAHRFWRVLLETDRVFKEFRAGFLGKCSPVHFFWGSFDLAVTRFSGRPAPPHPGGVPHLPNDVAREAYSHEVSSCGFWSGSEKLPEPIFYSYAYPAPESFSGAKIQPGAASWNAAFGEFVLPYDAVRCAADPDATLLGFLQSTYEAAATRGGWDRAALEATGDWPARVRSRSAAAN